MLKFKFHITLISCSPILLYEKFLGPAISVKHCNMSVFFNFCVICGKLCVICSKVQFTTNISHVTRIQIFYFYNNIYNLPLLTQILPQNAHFIKTNTDPVMGPKCEPFYINKNLCKSPTFPKCTIYIFRFRPPK